MPEADSEDDARDDAREGGEGERAALHATLDLAPRYVRHLLGDLLRSAQCSLFLEPLRPKKRHELGLVDPRYMQRVGKKRL